MALGVSLGADSPSRYVGTALWYVGEDVEDSIGLTVGFILVCEIGGLVGLILGKLDTSSQLQGAIAVYLHSY